MPEPVCDFCLAPGPTWEYPATAMDVVGHPTIAASADEWAACEECHRLIEAQKVGELISRVVVFQRRFVPPGSIVDGGVVVYPPMPVARANARANVNEFMRRRTGPARRYVT